MAILITTSVSKLLFLEISISIQLVIYALNIKKYISCVVNIIQHKSFYVKLFETWLILNAHLIKWFFLTITLKRPSKEFKVFKQIFFSKDANSFKRTISDKI